MREALDESAIAMKTHVQTGVVKNCHRTDTNRHHDLSATSVCLLWQALPRVCCMCGAGRARTRARRTAHRRARRGAGNEPERDAQTALPRRHGAERGAAAIRNHAQRGLRNPNALRCNQRSWVGGIRTAPAAAGLICLQTRLPLGLSIDLHSCGGSGAGCATPSSGCAEGACGRPMPFALSVALSKNSCEAT